jgi:hypothetical protein
MRAHTRLASQRPRWRPRWADAEPGPGRQVGLRLWRERVDLLPPAVWPRVPLRAPRTIRTGRRAWLGWPASLRSAVGLRRTIVTTAPVGIRITRMATGRHALLSHSASWLGVFGTAGDDGQTRVDDPKCSSANVPRRTIRIRTRTRNGVALAGHRWLSAADDGLADTGGRARLGPALAPALHVHGARHVEVIAGRRRIRRIRLHVGADADRQET